MRMFTPVVSPEQLPSVGAVEREFVDFKSGHSGDRYECAKDVAAFANHLGGTIIVGAVEDRAQSRLERYSPLAQGLATKAREDYARAVRDHCSPRPETDTVEIPQGGGFVVAVNVWPSANGVIGCQSSKDSDAWRFPRRATTHTPFLLPELIPMYTDAKIRRTVLLLSRITPGERVLVMGLGGDPAVGAPLRLLRVEEPLNVVVFGIGDGAGEFAISLDYVRTVFVREEDPKVRWRVIYDEGMPRR